ncbi:E3 ubiquitin-protein ligase E3D-like [Haliotis rubra]|uniref:E3 ubiquitin-protein ligase E3D-like n=1 Tax=Haliotis rubra TaxID=36100 RepID=UPI001EE55290|nr:E3 ubiquitin-protein ligase E3D-like [Haliotis rubra]
MAANVTLSELQIQEEGVNRDRVRIYAEYKSHLSVLNITLDFGSRCHKNISVSTDQTSVTAEFDARQCIFHLENVELLPLSCRGLQWQPSGELQMTLQVKDEKQHLDCEDQFGVACRKQEDVCANIQTHQNKCYCACCGKKILKDHSVFSRVLPLPSENWSDLAEFWFCHRHGDEEDQTPTVSPKPGDCLVGSFYILLSQSHMKMNSVTCSDSNELIRCSRCGNILGVTLQDDDVKPQRNGLIHPTSDVKKTTPLCHLYLHAVAFQDQSSLSPSVWSASSVEVFLCQLLLEQSRLYTSYRFLLQSKNAKEENTIKVLLWLIDQDLTLYMGEGHSGQPSHSVKVDGSRVAKVLFRSTVGKMDSSASSRCDMFLYRTWEKDNTVHGLTLPRPLILQLVSLLVGNTSSLPTSHRHLNGFHVSFLKKD